MRQDPLQRYSPQELQQLQEHAIAIGKLTKQELCFLMAQLMYGQIYMKQQLQTILKALERLDPTGEPPETDAPEILELRAAIEGIWTELDTVYDTVDTLLPPGETIQRPIQGQTSHTA